MKSTPPKGTLRGRKGTIDETIDGANIGTNPKIIK
jgi:hypothetical protein